MSLRVIWRAGWLSIVGAVVAIPQARADGCVPDRFEDQAYLVCTFDPATADLRLFWQDDQAKPYRSFSNLARSAGGSGKTLTFAINAGMYDTDFSPIGLYVENGRALRSVDTTTLDRPARDVPNFYKKPNGVFFVGDGTAGIATTEAYTANPPPARYATQSGPMLVIEGTLHPAFIRGSTDRTRRSGVGVCEAGKVRFAISDGRVNFDEFARLFRDQLACPNALFLDGGRGSGLYSPSLQRNDTSWHGGYGPILGVVE